MSEQVSFHNPYAGFNNGYPTYRQRPEPTFRSESEGTSKPAPGLIAKVRKLAGRSVTAIGVVTLGAGIYHVGTSDSLTERMRETLHHEVCLDSTSAVGRYCVQDVAFADNAHTKIAVNTVLRKTTSQPGVAPDQVQMGSEQCKADIANITSIVKKNADRLKNSTVDAAALSSKDLIINAALEGAGPAHPQPVSCELTPAASPAGP